MRILTFLVVLSLVLTCSVVALAKENVPQADDFESYDLGTIFSTRTADPIPPPPTSDVWGDSGTYLPDSRYDVVETAELDGNPNNQVVHVVEVPDSTTKNGHIRTNFWPTGTTQSSGVFVTTMDIMPIATTGAFKVTMTDGNGWTSAKNWLCAVGFGSDTGNTFFPGMTDGAHLGLQVSTTSWLDTNVTYQPNTWYTLQFVVDVDLKEYQVYFGLHGGSLSEVTSGPMPWITGALVTPTTFAGMFIATSNKAGEGGELLLDNVSSEAVPGTRFVWDSFTRQNNWQLGTTEDPNHFVWENGYNSVASITSNEMVFGTIDANSDGAFLNNYAPAAIDLSARVRSVGGNGAGIAYRKDTSKEAGNPGFAYKLFWSQDGTSVTLGYYWYGVLYSSLATYTPATPIDWTVWHTVRIRAEGSSHKVWLDGTQIIDWTDSHKLDGGHVIFYRDRSEYHVDDFVMLDMSVQAGSVADVKTLDVGTSVVLSGSQMCVSGAYAGFFYLEDLDRTAGIKVVSPDYVAVGNLVTVAGTVAEADGEKYIQATSVTPDTSTFTIAPLGMNTQSNGGSSGLSNIGLLTRVWGVVTWVSPDFTCFAIDDGSGVSYESGITGIKVYSDSTVPALDYFVACTGVASMDPGGIPVIRTRNYMDIDILKAP